MKLSVLSSFASFSAACIDAYRNSPRAHLPVYENDFCIAPDAVLDKVIAGEGGLPYAKPDVMSSVGVGRIGSGQHGDSIRG